MAIVFYVLLAAGVIGLVNFYVKDRREQRQFREIIRDIER